MKRLCVLPLVVVTMALVIGCANPRKALYNDLAQIPGGFQEFIITGGTIAVSTALRAFNGRMENGEFIIEQLSWDFDSPWADFNMTIKGFKPDAPVGLQVPGGRFK